MGSKSHSRDESSDEGDNFSGGDPPPSNSAVFSEGERVLAYHGPRIYEAKVQKTEFLKKEWKYFVHYLGWNKSWDEWVGADRLLKHSEENILKQQTLEKKQGVDKNTKSGRSGHTKPRSSAEAKADKEDTKTHVSRGKKRTSDSAAEVQVQEKRRAYLESHPKATEMDPIEDVMSFASMVGTNKRTGLPRVLSGDVYLIPDTRFTVMPSQPNVTSSTTLVEEIYARLRTEISEQFSRLRREMHDTIYRVIMEAFSRFASGNMMPSLPKSQHDEEAADIRKD